MWTDTNKYYVKTIRTYVNEHLFISCGGIQINLVSIVCRDKNKQYFEMCRGYTLKNLHFTACLRTDLYLLLILLTEKI